MKWERSQHYCPFLKGIRRRSADSSPKGAVMGNLFHAMTSWWEIPDIFTQVYPGLSSFEDNLDGIEPYIMQLVAKAEENVPRESQSLTPIFLLATAGEFLNMQAICRAESRFAPSQWETSLQRNAVSHWPGANLESALHLWQKWRTYASVNWVIWT